MNSSIGKFDNSIKELFIIRPIKKHPIIFTNNVPIGKSLINTLLNEIEQRYLNTDPINPPRPIANNVFNVY